jgi:hypothetical protein
MRVTSHQKNQQVKDTDFDGAQHVRSTSSQSSAMVVRPKTLLLQRLSLLWALLLSAIENQNAVTLTFVEGTINGADDETRREGGSDRFKSYQDFQVKDGDPGGAGETVNVTDAPSGIGLQAPDGDPAGAGETVTLTIGTGTPDGVVPPGAEVVYQYEYIDAVVVQMDKELIPVVEENSNVAYVNEQAAVVQLMSETVPPGIPLIQANDPIVPPPDPSKPCFKICVVDSGFDITHEDLVCFDFCCSSDIFSLLLIWLCRNIIRPL